MNPVLSHFSAGVPTIRTCRSAFAKKTYTEIEELSLRPPRPATNHLCESVASATTTTTTTTTHD